MRAGAFGSVSKTRYEVLLQGTRDEFPTADAEWREYDFVAKPGAPERRPPLLSPYHLRLDWLLWFLPFSGWRTHPWLAHLTAKLLSNDATASSLLRENPFDGGVAIPARPSPHAHPRTPNPARPSPHAHPRTPIPARPSPHAHAHMFYLARSASPICRRA